VNPTDNKSMNRFYPGDPKGTQNRSRVVSHHQEVVEQCDHLIDLHGGDLDENLRPYSYWTVTGNQKQDDFSRAMVLAFGLDHIIISADRPKDPKASRYLENTATTRGKPSFTAEAGRSGPVEIGDAARLSAGVRNVMAHLKMGGTVCRAGAQPRVGGEDRVAHRRARRHVSTRSSTRDAHVAKGAKVGIVTDYLNVRCRTSSRPRPGSSCSSARCRRSRKATRWPVSAS